MNAGEFNFYTLRLFRLLRINCPLKILPKGSGYYETTIQIFLEQLIRNSPTNPVLTSTKCINLKQIQQGTRDKTVFTMLHYQNIV